MPALYQFAQQMFQLLTDDEIGRSVPISSIGDDSIVCSTLAFASGSSQKFAQRWAWRPLSATQPGDRVRYIESFTSSSGTLNINSAATNYVDQTATNEVVLITKYEPQFICDAIQNAIKMLRRMDRTEFPCTGQERMWLGDLTWVQEPDDVLDLRWSNNPVASRNRYLLKKDTVTSAGAQFPSDWKHNAGGSDATFAYGTYPPWKTGNVFQVSDLANSTFAVYQDIRTGDNGVSSGGLRGKTVTAVAMLSCDAASEVRIRIQDHAGHVLAASSYHTGNSAFQELSASATLSTTSVYPYIRLVLDFGAVSSTTTVGEAYLTVSDINDAVRKDNYDDVPVPKADRNGGYGWEWNDQSQTLSLNNGSERSGGQYIVVSKRPYPGFDADRLATGAADQDVSDAPLIPVATGAIWKLFESHGDPRAEEWRDRFERLAVKHLNAPKPDINDRLMQRLAPAARRFG